MICRVCDSPDLDPVIDLGNQPWCNHFLRKEELGKEPYYPLRVVFCNECTTAQLDFTVRKEIMFGDHTYLSGVTRSLSDHFCRIAEEANSRFHPEKSGREVLDIGSNDGTQLKHFQKLGWNVLGVESSKTTAKLANEAGVPTRNQFFNEATANDIGQTFDLINAAGVFFHLEELHSVTEGIRICLAEDGVFIVQFLYMKRIVENGAFDQIYHEHLLYYNLRTLQKLLSRHGLEVFDAYLAPIHGGSMIAFSTHAGRRPPSERLQTLLAAEDLEQSNAKETYRNFAVRIQRMKEENLGYLDRMKGQGKRLFGMGAPVKGNTLLNYFGVGTQYLECLAEKNELRRGLYSPGMHIPVLIEKELTTQPDIYYVLAWNFKREILLNNDHLIRAGLQFYFPVNPREDIPS